MNIRANLLPLEGKYYGTKIDIMHGDHKTQLKIWLNTGNPSVREDQEEISDGHYESQEALNIANVIVNAINDMNKEK